MWITFPQRLWKSASSAACFVESVEKLSTENVDKWENFDMIRINAFFNVESVDNFSTFSVDKRKDDMITLISSLETVENVDNLSTFSVDKWRRTLI